MILKEFLKKALVLYIVLFAGFSASAQHKFTIKGQVESTENGKVILAYNKHGQRIKDTVKVTNGAFSITGQIGDPSFAEIVLNPQPGILKMEELRKRDKLDFMLESTKVEITSAGNLKDAEIKGGKAQDDYMLYLRQINSLLNNRDSVRNQIQAYRKEKNDAEMVISEKNAAKIEKDIDLEKDKFIRDHPASYVAFLLFINEHREVVNPDLELLFKQFSSAIQHSEAGQKIAASISLAKKLNVGNPAPDFTLNDAQGDPVSLSSLKGKNIILCFWFGSFYNLSDYSFLLGKINRRLASQNTVILNVYYNFSKSEDSDRWQSLIKSLMMTDYINVVDRDGIDAVGAQSTIAKAYGLQFSQLPQMYLIGPDGHFLARNLDVTDNALALQIEKLIKH